MNDQEKRLRCAVEIARARDKIKEFRDRLKVLKSYRDGSRIVSRPVESKKWELDDDPNWEFVNYRYRKATREEMDKGREKISIAGKVWVYDDRLRYVSGKPEKYHWNVMWCHNADQPVFMTWGLNDIKCSACNEFDFDTHTFIAHIRKP